ncbi:MAG: YdeI/OmpD-associated family protein [Candidatus Levybacteria bacterium]|nr:YdeI/OmpD-associated family protein [Candidatus Levybacteria bacterium]
MQKPIDVPIVTFGTDKEWEEWLSKHNTQEQGIFLRLYKKDSGKKTFSYEEALDTALCYGWIDGQTKSYDSESYLQRFTPRRKRSIWSKINIGNVERLIKEGRMRQGGLMQIDAAKKDGRWERAYDSSTTMSIPDDFLKLLSKHNKAEKFFKTLSRGNIYAIAWRLQTAKKVETRERRIQQILGMLERGEKFH